MEQNIARLERLCREAVGIFQLDLRGKRVLTEAASGPYVVTPLLAALAGADVLALTRDSRFGTADEIIDTTTQLALSWGIADRITYAADRQLSYFAMADIITNLGFVRPFPREIITCLKPTAVIPLMWETWEFRPSELDLAACLQKGVLVLGTNEQVPELRIFDYVGMIPVKMAFELGVEVTHASITVVGSSAFLKETLNAFAGAGRVTSIAAARGESLKEQLNLIRQTDVLVFMEHEYAGQLVGPDAELLWSDIAASNPGLVIAHICGNIDADGLAQSGLRYLPARIAGAGHMSVATDYVGPKPVVRLHAAGLKVGEAMHAARLAGLTGSAAIEHACANAPAMRFSETQLADARERIALY